MPSKLLFNISHTYTRLTCGDMKLSLPTALADPSGQTVQVTEAVVRDAPLRPKGVAGAHTQAGAK